VQDFRLANQTEFGQRPDMSCEVGLMGACATFAGVTISQRVILCLNLAYKRLAKTS
jgi:hypothetical protein